MDLVLEVPSTQPRVEIVTRIVRHDHLRPGLHRWWRCSGERRRIRVVEGVDPVMRRKRLEVIDATEVCGDESDLVDAALAAEDGPLLHGRRGLMHCLSARRRN